MATGIISTPASYSEVFVPDHGPLFQRLWSELPWERRADAPRRECFFNDFGKPYTYGSGVGARTYFPVEWHEAVRAIQVKLQAETGQVFEGCFINGYEGPRDHLGWHADDSPEIDGSRPIAVVSFGSAREIWFCEKGSSEKETLVLAPGSLLLMHAGMQATHKHRIPKHGADCGPRISLTFRGLVQPKADL